MSIDHIDKKILIFLSKNARASNTSIAKILDMAPSAIFQRIRKLEGLGIIKQYHISVDESVIGFPFKAILFLKPKQPYDHSLATRLYEHPCIVSVYQLTGEYTLLAHLIGKSLEHLTSIVNEDLNGLSEIASISMQLVLNSHSDKKSFSALLEV